MAQMYVRKSNEVSTSNASSTLFASKTVQSAANGSSIFAASRELVATYDDDVDLDSGCLRFVNPSSAASTIKLSGSNANLSAISLEYSLDNGATWTEWTTKTTAVKVNSYRSMLLRAVSTNDTISTYAIVKFVMTGVFAAYGNIMSLLDKTMQQQSVPSYAFHNLFSDCTSLVRAPALPATTLAAACYYYMFYNCTSLAQAPALPATTLAFYCYQNMFDGCSSLTTAPALPATTLAGYCYGYMFQNCTSLTQAPALPATTLAGSCYYRMFYGCSSLTTAPALPATTLVSNCYYQMFRNCNKLVSIDVNFTAWSPTNATSGWVNGAGTQATGTKTFTCPASLPKTTGNNNIPTGWTIVEK